MLVARNNFFTGSPPPPTITSFSPTSLANGTGNVTITGTNFITGATSVTVDGTASTTTVDSNTQLTVAFPSRGRGTYAVVVTTPGGSATANFTYTVTPFISSISPSSVYNDYGSGYTIYGGRFSSSGAGSVYLSNGGYYGISVANDGQLSFNPGALAAGSYTAYVTAPDGWSNGVGISVSSYPVPSISSVSDGRGGNGSIPGSTITLSGSNFTGASVSIGGTAVSASVSATSISFSCPSFGSDGTRTITVTTAGNQSASTSVYTWTAKGATSATYTSGSGSYTPPQWANYLDVVVRGGGGAGGGASINAWGGGGYPGSASGGTINLLSAGFSARSYSVGAGGTSGGLGVGGAGGTSSAAGYSAGGGAGGCSACNGGGLQNGSAFTAGGITSPAPTAGVAGNSSQPGGNPGSGGGGGNSGLGPYNGIAGRGGAVYFRAYQ